MKLDIFKLHRVWLRNNTVNCIHDTIYVHTHMIYAALNHGLRLEMSSKILLESYRWKIQRNYNLLRYRIEIKGVKIRINDTHK